jgi:multifunctional beta-oxidation protein
MDFVPNFNPAKLLHGEQYLKIKSPIPTSGTLVNHVRLREVLDKGKAAAVTVIVDTKDKETGKSVFENQSTVFLRGSGGFGGKKTGAGKLSLKILLRLTPDRGNASAVNAPPKRKPDAVVEEKTTPEQAAIYRLSGDYNPLHIDPGFASMGGFPKPSESQMMDWEASQLTSSSSRPLLHGYCRQARSQDIRPIHRYQGSIRWHRHSRRDSRHRDVERGRQGYLW